jgi:uncharacterized protein (TIGR01777 family)
MKIAILGGSGFIGKEVATHLVQAGHEVEIWSRNPEKYGSIVPGSIHLKKWPLEPSKKDRSTEAIVNLAGETINQRWTEKAKERIVSSRVKTTKALIEEIKEENISPKILINASAVGYYGTSLEDSFTEADGPGEDFLAYVTKAWEQEADQASQYGVRVVKARFGVVLGKGDGALTRMVLPYKLFGGGPIGTGKQWIAWIHSKDVAGLIQFAIENTNIEGALNCTAPQTIRMNEFGLKLGNVMGRPHWLPVPPFALRILLGEMSDLVMKGQRVIPAKALEKGYRFSYADLELALRDLLK